MLSLLARCTSTHARCAPLTLNFNLISEDQILPSPAWCTPPPFTHTLCPGSGGRKPPPRTLNHNTPVSHLEHAEEQADKADQQQLIPHMAQEGQHRPVGGETELRSRGSIDLWGGKQRSVP